MTRLSVLDLSPVPQGSTPAHALRNSRNLAQHAEQWGYTRYWVAEHHNMRGIASAATSVVIAFIAEGTTAIRVGAGGIMLPNHSPLVIAEQFGTLASLYPDRIDLGLGRAPGTDQLTSQALRRTLHGSADDFPRDVLELQGYFKNAVPGQSVVAVPGELDLRRRWHDKQQICYASRNEQYAYSFDHPSLPPNVNPPPRSGWKVKMACPEAI